MSSDRGKYRLKARAVRREQTRARIVAATVELHEEVGPAHTTIAEIARRAGVQRLTVYSHFPESRDLLRACQGHFLAAHPPPAIAPGAGTESHLQALQRALTDLYRWYRDNLAIERHVQHDRHVLPELDELMRQNADRQILAAASAYSAVLAGDQRRQKAVTRLLCVAFDFRTWELLNATGADEREIARLFIEAVECAAESPPAQGGRGVNGDQPRPHRLRRGARS